MLNLLLFLGTFLGGIIPIISKWWNDAVSRKFTLFSGAFLFAICFSHLIPETFERGDMHVAGALVVVGFFIQFVIQKITHGVEHGHTCQHSHNKSMAWSLLWGMALHSFVEGLPLSNVFFSIDTLVPLYIAILIHKIPSAVIISQMFLNAGFTKNKVVFVSIIFAMLAPMASMIGNVLSVQVNGFTAVVEWIIPIIAGSFLQIATTIFFETSSKQHHITRTNWMIIIAGVVIGIVSGQFHYH